MYFSKDEVNTNFDKVVKECISKHEGGESFFDALDEKIRGDRSFLHSMGMKISKAKYDFVIVSGRFGLVFKAFVERERLPIKVVCVNGGLRGGNDIETTKDTSLNSKLVIFVDASFYSGTTRDKVKRYVEACGGLLTGTYVFYDGSKKADPSVHSFYRYYQ